MIVRKHPPVRRFRPRRNNEPSARQIATLIRQIKKQGTQVLFVENRSNPRLLKRIADEAVEVVDGTLYSDALAPGDSSISLFPYNAPAMAKN